ncbi:MAG: hypothetical protein MK138_10990, partial [Planctomycetes bacterium]|nr:hypothetical protein [Planctomycetota bacterium]
MFTPVPTATSPGVPSSASPTNPWGLLSVVTIGTAATGGKVPTGSAVRPMGTNLPPLDDGVRKNGFRGGNLLDPLLVSA